MTTDEILRAVMKPLGPWGNWSASHRIVLEAQTSAGLYRITQRFFPEDRFALELPSNDVRYHSTLAAAQAAAEADYRARIAAALDLDKIVALVEAGMVIRTRCGPLATDGKNWDAALAAFRADAGEGGQA